MLQRLERPFKQRGGRLTVEQRREIARRFIAGEKGTALAVEYGVEANYPASLARQSGYRRRPGAANILTQDRADLRSLAELVVAAASVAETRAFAHSVLKRIRKA